MPTLYDLTGNWKTVYQLSTDGTIDPETIADTLDSIDEAIEDKAIGYVKVWKQIEADADVIDAEIKRLTERKNSYKANVDQLKARLMQAMEETNNTKFKTPLFTISIQGNGGKQPVKIDEKNLQADAFKIVHTPDRDAIYKRLQAGEEIVGAELMPRGKHIGVR